MSTTCDPFQLLGRVLSGTFRVDEVVGQGGYGVVYKAFHLHFRSPVALKVLKIPDGLGDASRARFWEEFRKEAEVQFQLSALTPNVVRPFHIGEVDTGGKYPLPVMALEWLEGKNLETIEEERRSSGRPAAGLPYLLDRLGGAARAIHIAHNLELHGGRFSVIHRDLKPENLYSARVGSKEVVKVLDFGTSKTGHLVNILAGAPTLSTAPNEFSPPYAAPEQWTPKSLGQTGPWTDVWGMALTLVELMKGEHLLTGNMYAMMFACLNQNERPTPRTHGLTVSDAVEDAFARALALDPRKRTKSLRDLWVDLRRAVSDDLDEAPISFERKEEVAVSEGRSHSRLRAGGAAPQTGTFAIAQESDSLEFVLEMTGTGGAEAHESFPPLPFDGQE